MIPPIPVLICLEGAIVSYFPFFLQKQCVIIGSRGKQGISKSLGGVWVILHYIHGGGGGGIPSPYTNMVNYSNWFFCKLRNSLMTLVRIIIPFTTFFKDLCSSIVYRKGPTQHSPRIFCIVIVPKNNTRYNKSLFHTFSYLSYFPIISLAICNLWVVWWVIPHKYKQNVRRRLRSQTLAVADACGRRRLWSQTLAVADACGRRRLASH